MARIDYDALNRIRDKITFSLSMEQDDTPLEGNVSVTDEPEKDAKLERDIAKRLDQGDDWAWCVVTVTAAFGPWSGQDSLHGCSYHDEADFRAGGYFDDMQDEALADLAREINKSATVLDEILKLIGAQP